MHCVRENQSPDIYHFLYLSIFLSLQSNFLLQISQLLWEPVFKFIHLESGQVYCGTENKMLRFIFFTIFFYFSFFHLLLHCNTYGKLCQRFFRNSCAEDFEIWYKCWVWLVVLCKRESACCCISFPLFDQLSFSPIKPFITEFSAPTTASLQILYTPWEGSSILWERKSRFFD